MSQNTPKEYKCNICNKVFIYNSLYYPKCEKCLIDSLPLTTDLKSFLFRKNIL